MANKIFALTGPRGSGKAELIKRIKDLGIHYVPIYTTRSNWKDDDPDRELVQEISSQDYTKRTFLAKFTYHGDYYGIQKDDLLTAVRDHAVSVTMLEENGAKQLRRFLRQNFFTIFIMADYVSIIEHLLQRHCTNDEIKDLLQYDETNHLFNGWKNADFVIKNIHDPAVSLAQLLSIMGLSQPLPPEKFHALAK